MDANMFYRDLVRSSFSNGSTVLGSTKSSSIIFNIHTSTYVHSVHYSNGTMTAVRLAVHQRTYIGLQFKEGCFFNEMTLRSAALETTLPPGLQSGVQHCK